MVCSRRRAKMLIWLLMIAGPAAASSSSCGIAYDFAATGLECTNVSFTSPGATSGATQLFGSLVSPTATQVVGAAVLISGSGPNNRWEATPSDAPFLDVAVAIASRGVAVLTYDKRSCATCANRSICLPVHAHSSLPACGSCPCLGLLRRSTWCAGPPLQRGRLQL